MYPSKFAGILSITLACALPLGAQAPASGGWVEKSNADTATLLKAIGSFSPEEVGNYGLRQYDTGISDLRPGYQDRARAAIGGARGKLEAELRDETDPQVREDLSILINACDLRVEDLDLGQRLELDYTDVGRSIFEGEFVLLNEEVAPERRPSALVRLRAYTGLEPGTTPFTQLAEEAFKASLSDPTRWGPYKGKVESDLAAQDRYVKGIRDLLAKYSIKDAEPAMKALETQLHEYGDWVRREVLPHARDDFRRQPEIYAQELKAVGLDISPQDLIRKAEFEYAEIQDELQSKAAEVAKIRGLKDSDYRSVIRELKKDQLPASEVEAYYRGIIARIEETIHKEHMIALPDRPLSMRLASDAESAAQPAPHYLPPTIIGNTGERGFFVIPQARGNPSANPAEVYDDFSYKAVAWTLSAHEGRPGHDLQFTAMVERGVSQARSIFAFNSVNVEGWALYSEAEFLPYEPPEGQLIALDLRLLRAARAILDPMLNLGLISHDRAHDILTRDVVLSEAFTKEELDRFMFRMPGQATAYFYGFTRIMALRARTEIALGSRFDRYAFNNFLIQQGLLPPDLLAKAVETEFVPSQER
jgi:hypothetical protein